VFVTQKPAARVCLAFTGSLWSQASAAAQLLEDAGVPTDLYNLRFLKPIDEAYLLELLHTYETFVVLEEGTLHGGFGEYVAGLASGTAHVLQIGVPEGGPRLGSREDLLHLNGLDAPAIFQKVCKTHILLREKTVS
jgi:1-deoxy-D-xylulose-5-phosphate synthase